jgi:hypothetical protein
MKMKEKTSSFNRFADAVKKYGLNESSVKATAHTSAVSIRHGDIVKRMKG